MVAIKIAAAGLLIGAATASPYYSPPSNGTHYTTEVVTAITTYCPGATTLTYGDKTYTVTSETTLTITDCPCTLSYPVKPTKPVVPHPVYTTEVITAVTTYCPEPTTLTYGNKTVTVTAPGTVTVTDCHFTTTHPASEQPYPMPTPGKPGKPGYTAPAVPGKPTTAAPVPVPVP
ncbi:cell wall glyco, partial [Fusarium agapanthi]